MSTTFRPIATTAGPALAKLDALREQSRQRRLETIRERGWSENVSCLRCGDTGIVWSTKPAHQLFACDCEPGVALRARWDREERWPTMVPRKLREYRLDTSPQAGTANELAEWITTNPWHRGENALLIGNVGTGKTGLAIGAMRAAHDVGVSTELIVLSDWLIQQRAIGDAGDGDPMNIASIPSLLVIDDVGTQKNTDWVHERIYVLINRRYNDEKATIVTSNHSDYEHLRESLGDRATSRLMESCRVFPIDGPDLRLGGH